MAVMYEKGLVVIPKKIRMTAGLRPGSRLRFRAERDGVFIEAEAAEYERWRANHKRLRQKADMTGKQAETHLAKIEKRRKERMLHVP